MNIRPTNMIKVDITDVAALTRALNGSQNPVQLASQVCGIAIAIIEDQRGKDFARALLLEAARRLR